MKTVRAALILASLAGFGLGVVNGCGTEPLSAPRKKTGTAGSSAMGDSVGSDVGTGGTPMGASGSDGTGVPGASGANNGGANGTGSGTAGTDAANGGASGSEIAGAGGANGGASGDDNMGGAGVNGGSAGTGGASGNAADDGLRSHHADRRRATLVVDRRARRTLQVAVANTTAAVLAGADHDQQIWRPPNVRYGEAVRITHFRSVRPPRLASPASPDHMFCLVRSVGVAGSRFR